MGLGQVMLKQPEVLKEEFPGPQWDSAFLKLFAFNFGWVVPICRVDYSQMFVMNTVVLPAVLFGLVAATWLMNVRQDKKQQAQQVRKTPPSWPKSWNNFSLL
jgi:uncharacterized membrane protein YkvI